MTIYRNKANGKSYALSVLKNPIPFLDGTTRLGVYAFPYYWEGEVMFFRSTDYEGECKKWVEENFEELAKI